MENKIPEQLKPIPKNQNQIKILDLLSSIANAADIAAFIGQDVYEDFFEAYDPDDEEERDALRHDFKRHSAKMRVVVGAVGSIKQAINAINVLIMAESVDSKKASLGG